MYYSRFQWNSTHFLKIEFVVAGGGFYYFYYNHLHINLDKEREICKKKKFYWYKRNKCILKNGLNSTPTNYAYTVFKYFSLASWFLKMSHSYTLNSYCLFIAQRIYQIVCCCYVKVRYKSKISWNVKNAFTLLIFQKSIRRNQFC